MPSTIESMMIATRRLPKLARGPDGPLEVVDSG
jgi:hypothetical protein